MRSARGRRGHFAPALSVPCRKLHRKLPVPFVQLPLLLLLLLLVPGWHELIGKPLPEIVAAQWETTTRILLNDLEALAPARWCVARYDVLVADPGREIAHVCKMAGLGWDQPLDARLPLANHTVLAPQADKWRRREEEIEAALAPCADTRARAAWMAGRD